MASMFLLLSEPITHTSEIHEIKSHKSQPGIGFPWLTLWGQRIRGPGPLYVRAQGLSRGELLPRTHNENPKKGPRIRPRTILCLTPHKTAEETDKLSTGAGQGRKLQTSSYRILHLTDPYSKPCYLTFPTIPNHSRYGLTGQVCTLESKKLTHGR